MGAAVRGAGPRLGSEPVYDGDAHEVVVAAGVVDLVDALQFLGLPVAVASLLTLWRRRDHWLNRYGLLFWGVLLALDLSGTARAEVGRLWMFLMPLALMGLYLAAGHGLIGRRQVGALLGAQFLACVLIGARWMTP